MRTVVFSPNFQRSLVVVDIVYFKVAATSNILQDVLQWLQHFRRNSTLCGFSVVGLFQISLEIRNTVVLCQMSYFSLCYNIN